MQGHVHVHVPGTRAYKFRSVNARSEKPRQIAFLLSKEEEREPRIK
jgi:hypothetical protein